MVLSSSLHNKSNSETLAQEFAKGAAEAGYKVEFESLRGKKIGQLKTMLDRANSLYSNDYKFREIYLLTSAADTDAKAMNIAKRGIGGWIACFDGVKLKGAPCATGAKNPGDVKKNSLILKKAFAMGVPFFNCSLKIVMSGILW